MKVRDLMGELDKYDDIQVFEYTSNDHILNEDNISRLDILPINQYLDADVLETFDMDEMEYNRKIYSNGTKYIDFGDEYDYDSARVLVIMVGSNWQSVKINRFKTIKVVFDRYNAKDLLALNWLDRQKSASCAIKDVVQRNVNF